MHKLALISYVAQASFINGVVGEDLITETSVQMYMRSSGQTASFEDIRDGMDTLYKAGFLEPVNVTKDKAIYRATKEKQ